MEASDSGNHPRIALSIAGLDPSAGAGIIADLRTFEDIGVWGMGVVTTITYQNTSGIEGRFDPATGAVSRQIEVLLRDCVPDAIKIGALGKALAEDEFIPLLKERFDVPVVFDPVLMGSSGGNLTDLDHKECLVESLVPLTTITTPNVEEVTAIWGFRIDSFQDMESAARGIVDKGANAVLITGGKDERDGKSFAVDLFFDGRDVKEYRSPWYDNLDIHGTGCVLSSAIAAHLALGEKLETSVDRGIKVVGRAIRNAVSIGGGSPCATVRGFNN